MAQLLFRLVDILSEACATFEQVKGCAPGPELEDLMARRIRACAEAGERDANRLQAAALDGFWDFPEEAAETSTGLVAPDAQH